ncbi:bifunctional acetate--CoA ligase family protein/GNAT family N-acetyltransferase [Gilvimarinus sp. SDUM040013]|uniref:Bifunctional acetate--CoA ligase family protein/GNAT family N-acetyltransferase n=1 Tax=Gilvimarinus gilvus TaxID=3058038 RepID=A0ABU4RUB0_9GAMM|nr:bifunctional acetate--CoA ligase family protein/GNAT family N-acetyltransferase [Gilvimarinus sp. SDUM040013]MDO3388231.1 bifunctional acetate--CoA ligase family protein/GNAT family N-acetyltransferase [Gilvimarinus sp. SDUM040013]MDX6847781.1 bifunctional acetate--CoA ligase family protein/GNAT family N-acetyltransferase [Gilvimarinus sp. SDUM040013]
MSINAIDKLLRPASVAVIGASNRANRPGNAVMRNLLQASFAGPIMPVNPKYKAINGVLAYATIGQLPVVPDLAIICTRADRVPDIIDELGQLGCRNAIVIAAGLSVLRADGTQQSVQALMLERARHWLMRILGPNSLGVMVPGIGLNASYAHTAAAAGKIAFVSQSSAVCTTILDWAQRRKIGFSHFVALGDACDVDYAELLDYLGRDAKTSAILLYVENIRRGRLFMSAARAASTNKPILVIKTGHSLESLESTADLTRDQIGADGVYDAAFKRAGMLRVGELRELFAAVETLAHGKPIRGERLTVLTNGVGPALMAVDTLLSDGGRLETLNESTLERLRQVVPLGGHCGNPVNLLGDAPPELYQDVLDVLLEAPEVENILVLHCPSALVSGETYAAKVIQTIKRKTRKVPNVLVAWMGESAAVVARERFSRAGIASFRTPEGAVGAFMHMVQYRRNQKLLMEAPESIPADVQHDIDTARTLIQSAYHEGFNQLSAEQSVALLDAYGIQTVPTSTAHHVDGLAAQAEILGFPVALKIISPDILHKSDVGGVVLNLHSGEEVELTASNMLERVFATIPHAHVEGFTLQHMARRAGAHELRIAVKNDPVFGPVILLGEGGAELDTERHSVVALPPLNMALSRYLVIQALAEGKVRDTNLQQPLDRHALSVLLTQVNQIIIDHPEIHELDINPVLASGNELTVVDISVRLGDPNERRLAIRPYPKELEEIITLKSGRRAVLRPIRPEDETTHKEFDSKLSASDRYNRYFAELPSLGHEQLARQTQIDYDREMAFIASAQNEKGQFETLGVVRVLMDPDNTEGEFAVIVRSDIKGQGLGKILLQKMIRYCADCGIDRITGETMLQNNGMAALARALGFSVKRDMEEGIIFMRYDFPD